MVRLNDTRAELLRDALALFDGKPPHDRADNQCRGDAYFGKWMERVYRASVDELRKALKEYDEHR